MQVKVTYNSGHGPMHDLDDKIQNAMKSAECIWYARGFDLKTGERDICFDYRGPMPSNDLDTGIIN